MILTKLAREEQKIAKDGSKKSVHGQVRKSRDARTKVDIAPQVLLIDMTSSMVSRLDALVGILSDTPSFLPGRSKKLTRYAVIRDALARGVAELECLAAEQCTVQKIKP